MSHEKVKIGIFLQDITRLDSQNQQKGVRAGIIPGTAGVPALRTHMDNFHVNSFSQMRLI